MLMSVTSARVSPPGLQHALDEELAEIAQGSPDHLAAQFPDVRDRGRRDHRIAAHRFIDCKDHPNVGMLAARHHQAAEGQRHAIVLAGEEIGDLGLLVFRIDQLDGHALLGIVPELARQGDRESIPAIRMCAKRSAGRVGAGASGAEQPPMSRAARTSPSPAPRHALNRLSRSPRSPRIDVTTVTESISFVSKFRRFDIIR